MWRISSHFWRRRNEFSLRLNAPVSVRLHLLHLETPIFNGVIVTGKADIALGAIESFRWMFDLTAIEGGDVHVEDLGAVERDLDLLSLHFDLLEIPFAHRPQVAVLGPHAVIERAVVLSGLQPRLALGGPLGVV